MIIWWWPRSSKPVLPNDSNNKLQPVSSKMMGGGLIADGRYRRRGPPLTIEKDCEL